MGTASGMDYTKMLNLISYLEAQKLAIVNLLTDLSTSAPEKIAEAYSGEAATAYKTTLTTVITNIETTLDTMIASLKTNTEEKQAEYAAQDKKLQESIAMPNAQ